MVMSCQFVCCCVAEPVMQRGCMQVQASTDQESVNKTIIKSSATLLHANSRLMVGNMKHVELSTRGDLVAELTRDVDRMLRKVAWVPADAEVPEAKQTS